tara:strand:- start:5491 stop:5664 length:174 start_codon:yes stop_codon:yes gene_type:complete
MDTDRFKSIAISMPSYTKLKEMAKNKFDAPVSMAKIVEMAINKSYEKFVENKDEHRS